MSSRQERLREAHRLSDLTTVAFDTVFAATRLARGGYSDNVRRALEEHDAWTKGWFAEGVAQGLYLYDLDSGNQFEHTLTFLRDGIDRMCVIASYVGIGLAISHSGVFSEDLYGKLDSQLKPWVLDGAGFYKLMTAEVPTGESVPLPNFAGGDAVRSSAYAAGIGRGLWFSLGESRLSAIVEAIARFPEEMHGAVWRGVGFASTYAGGTPDRLSKLSHLAGEYLDHVRIGCVAAVLEQADESVSHREDAAKIYTGRSIAEIIQLVSSMPGGRNEDGTIVMAPTSVSWTNDVLKAIS